MNITFKELKLVDFKNHDSLEVAFGDITTISGPNGAGKSSIAEAITWLLYGTDPFGTKIEPKPIGNADAETKVELLIQIDDKDILLGRTQKKTAKYYINEVPEKTTKFNELVESLFDKNLFLSIFNPNYFSSQHWQDQRVQLLQYVSEPLKKEVFAELSKLQVELLEEKLKKHSLDDLQKLHADRKKKHEKSLERASERVVTLKEQYEKQKADSSDIDKENIENKLASLKKERMKLDEVSRQSQQNKQQYDKIQYQIEGMKQQVLQQKDVVLGIKDEKLQDTCNTCGQALQDEAIEKVKEHKVKRFNAAKEMGSNMVKKLKELEETCKAFSTVEQVDMNRAREIDEEIFKLNTSLRQIQQLDILQSEIDEAESVKEQIRKEKNESIAILDAIKEFRTKRSELMVTKIKSLFVNIDVQLYETLKNGEERATFEILMDSKSYSRLSTAEKIRAGLELVDVLSRQSGLVTPTFIDNAESILRFGKPTGQLIIARVEDTEFTVKTESTQKEEVIND